jgi:hypothetical protein
LIASRSRRLCRSVTSWMIFSRSAWLTLAPPFAPLPRSIGRSIAFRRRARSTETSEPRLIHRLHQVVDGVDLERLDGVLVEGGHEDDVRRGLVLHHAARHLEAVEPRHLDVEEHDVRLQPFDGRQRFDAVAGLADDFDAADLAEQVAELVARQLFVVDEHGAQVHGHAVTRSGSARSGISMLAQVPWPGTLRSFNWLFAP